MGWCISDLETSEVISSFLGALKKQSPCTDVSVIMTDDGNLLIYYNGLVSSKCMPSL